MNELREADGEETSFVSRSIGRLFRLVGGEDVDVALRPVLFVTVCGALAFSSLWSFVGIWAKTKLGASDTELGLMFMRASLTGVASGYAGGALSDRIGRKPVMIAGFGVEALLLVSRLGDAVARRDPARGPPAAEEGRLFARRASEAEIVRGDPPRHPVPAVRSLRKPRVPRLRRVRDRAADLARRKPWPHAVGVGS